MKSDELTWKDIRRIVESADGLCSEWGIERMRKEGQEAYYKEVLRMFVMGKTEE